MRVWILLASVLFSAAVNAERLVSAGGSLTEIIYALGAEQNLVGVDSSSQYPSAALALPDIGYYRALNVEGVLSVEPEKLLLLEGSGPQTVLSQLEALGVKATVINNPKSIDGLFTTIAQVAKATNRLEQGKTLIAGIQEQLAQVSRLPALRDKTAVFLMSAGDRGLVAAGQNTTPQLIFDHLNVVNPFAELQGFKIVSPEVMATHGPDIILLASHTSRDLTESTLCEAPQLALWASEKGCKLYKVDSLQFIGLTPRLADAIAQTHELLK